MHIERSVVRGSAIAALLGWTATAVGGSGFVYVNETNAIEEADFASLSGPMATVVYAGFDTASLMGAIFESKVTEPEGESPSVIAEVGWGPLGSDPRFSPDWTWSVATFSGQIGTEDNYSTTLNISMPGEYSYTYRFSLNGGSSWTLADLDGAGSNEGNDFDPANLGSITVLIAPAIFDFANFKSRYFQQTSSAGAVGPSSFTGVHRLFGQGLDTATINEASVTFPDSGPTFVLNDYDNVQFIARFLGQFPDEAALNSAMPEGTYSFDCNSPFIGSGSGTIDQPGVNRWSNVPTVENYDALQGVSATSNLSVDYVTPILDSGAVDGGVFWNAFDPVALQTVAFGFRSFSESSDFEIPASALSASRRFDVTIVFSAREFQSSGIGALATATGFPAWDTVNTLSFRTAPACPGDANGDQLANFSDITAVLANFGNDYGADTGPGDANGDGVVTFTDITTVLANFGNNCAPV